MSAAHPTELLNSVLRTSWRQHGLKPAGCRRYKSRKIKGGKLKGKLKGYDPFFCKIGFYYTLNRYFAGSMENNSSGLLDLTWCFSFAEEVS